VEVSQRTRVVTTAGQNPLRTGLKRQAVESGLRCLIIGLRGRPLASIPKNWSSLEAPPVANFHRQWETLNIAGGKMVPHEIAVEFGCTVRAIAPVEVSHQAALGQVAFLPSAIVPA